jgi:predicted GIY-YIG superfamily endonuclease
MIGVYVIKCSTSNKNYTGMAEDVNARLKEHNAGKSKFTSGYGPWKLIYTEEYPDRESARKREKYLKSAAGRRFIKKLENGLTA